MPAANSPSLSFDPILFMLHPALLVKQLGAFDLLASLTSLLVQPFSLDPCGCAATSVEAALEYSVPGCYPETFDFREITPSRMNGTCESDCETQDTGCSFVLKANFVATENCGVAVWGWKLIKNGEERDGGGGNHASLPDVDLEPAGELKTFELDCGDLGYDVRFWAGGLSKTICLFCADCAAG